MRLFLIWLVVAAFQARLIHHATRPEVQRYMQGGLKAYELEKRWVRGPVK